MTEPNPLGDESNDDLLQPASNASDPLSGLSELDHAAPPAGQPMAWETFSNSPTPKRGDDGLTDSQRRFDRIVRVIGWLCIVATVVAWIIIGRRRTPPGGMHPLYTWIPGSIPVLLVGALIGLHGAIFGHDARAGRAASWKLLGIGLPLTGIGVALLFSPIFLAGILSVGVGGMASLLGVAGLLTGQNFARLLRSYLGE